MKSLLAFVMLFLTLCAQAQVKIGSNPDSINVASILEMEATDRGILIPRMTTTQRDAISTPPDGLQVYNTTTRTIDVYRINRWESSVYTDPKLVYVYSLNDLPAPSGSVITLDATTTYIFRGIVNITPYYLNLNGASLLGLDPARDGISSTVSGAILRSTGVSVYLEGLAVVPLSGSTKAYDFSDATGTKFVNLFAGCSVVEVGIASLGVGQISGFEAVTYVKNYWNVTDGLKLAGNIGKFAGQLNYMKGITSGSAIEFLTGLTIQDVDLSSNYFFFTGQTGIKLNPGATVGRGRLTSNMFKGVGTPLNGLTAYDIGWKMLQNTNIPDTRAYGYLYMNANTTATFSTPNNTYVKVAGSTTSTKLLKFSSPANNRLTYLGNDVIVASVFIVIAGKSPANSADFSVAISKNGSVLSGPFTSTGAMTNNQAFSLTLNREVDMVTNDYVEVFIKTTTSTTPITITDMQFRVSD